MSTKRLGLRERRKIYEDAINVVAQAQKAYEAISGARQEKTIRTFTEKQITKCTSIIAATLGYDETVSENGGVKTHVYVLDDENYNCAIEKEELENIVKRLPGDKQLRESLWKMTVKKDGKSRETFLKIA